MQHDDGASEAGTVNRQFGDLMRERRESKGWSQRQLAEMLRVVDLRLDPSAITRIERGTRDVKLTEAIAISNLLEFHLDELSFSPEAHFIMREFSEIELTIRARKALLDAIRHIDRWVNSTDPQTEEAIIKRRGLANQVDLYIKRLREHSAFQLGNSLGDNRGDNFAVYFSEVDQAIKQTIVESVVGNVLVDDEFIDDYNRKRLGRGLASLIPTSGDWTTPEEEGDGSET